jgi:predicted acyl esterase
VADRFATGRRIRLLITGGSFPRSERNLGHRRGPGDRHGDGTLARLDSVLVDLLGSLRQ